MKPKTLTTSGRLKWTMQEEFLKLHSWEFCETPQHGCQQSKPNETRCLCHRCHPLFRISTEDLRTSCVEKMKAILAALPARSLQWHGSLWVDETVKNCRSSWRLTSILEDYRLLWADSFITYSGWGMDPLVKTENSGRVESSRCDVMHHAVGWNVPKHPQEVSQW